MKTISTFIIAIGLLWAYPAFSEPMSLNSNTYAIASSATSAAITLSDTDMQQTRIIVSNPTAYDVCIVGATTTQGVPTAVCPTSATAGAMGLVVPAGAIETFTKKSNQIYIGVISKTADSGKFIYVQVGSGE